MEFLERPRTRIRSVRGGAPVGWFSVLVLLLALPSAASATEPCHVLNVRTGDANVVLQEAVDAAAPGDALRVSGACHGDTTIEKDLTITGKHGATLDGTGTTHHVLSIPVTASRETTVAISDLTIANGTARPEPESYEDEEGDGGGIDNWGRLTLTHVLVTNNEATAGNGGPGPISESAAGGGIVNLGQLVLDHSAVVGNRAEIGGGIYSNGYDAGGISVTLIHSTVACNAGGGIQDEYSVALTLIHSQVDEVESYGESAVASRHSTIGRTRCGA